MATESVLFRGVKTPLDAMPVGASRIAGPPDLPIGVPWPLGPDHVRVLPMVLQLSLDELPPTRLPRAGTLYFFGVHQVGYRGEPGEIPAAIVYAPPGATLVRAAVPPEANDETYWDGTDVARCEGFRVHVSESEDDEPRDDDLHVLFPTRKDSAAFDEMQGVGFVPILEMRSDYAIAMNWGDAAWATWIVHEQDLAAGRFDRAIANVWIG